MLYPPSHPGSPSGARRGCSPLRAPCPLPLGCKSSSGNDLPYVTIFSVCHPEARNTAGAQQMLAVNVVAGEGEESWPHPSPAPTPLDSAAVTGPPVLTGDTSSTRRATLPPVSRGTRTLQALSLELELQSWGQNPQHDSCKKPTPLSAPSQLGLQVGTRAVPAQRGCWTTAKLLPTVPTHIFLCFLQSRKTAALSKKQECWGGEGSLPRSKDSGSPP